MCSQCTQSDRTPPNYSFLLHSAAPVNLAKMKTQKPILFGLFWTPKLTTSPQQTFTVTAGVMTRLGGGRDGKIDKTQREKTKPKTGEERTRVCDPLPLDSTAFDDFVVTPVQQTRQHEPECKYPLYILYLHADLNLGHKLQHIHDSRILIWVWLLRIWQPHRVTYQCCI